MKRLRNRLSLALLPVVIFPLLAMGFQGMLLLNKSSLEHIGAQIELLASNSHIHLNEILRNYRLNLAALPQSESVVDYLNSQNPREKSSYLGPKVLRLFHQLIQQNPGLLQLTLLNNLNQEELKAGEGVDPFAPIDGSNYQFVALMHMQPEHFYERFIFSKELGQYVLKQGLQFGNSRPELSIYDGEPAQYTLLMTASLAQLGDYLREQERLYGFNLLLVEHSSQQLVFSNDRTLLKIVPPNEEGEITIGEQSYHVAKERINDDLDLLALIPSPMIAAASATIRTSLIVWLMVSMGILLLLSSWILKRLVFTPMERLRHVMLQVSREEIRQIPLLPSEDEMSELHNQFSNMLHRLEASQHELEKSVFIDPITGLNNRNAFLRQLQKQLVHARQEGNILFLGQLKLHNLSGINDTFGSTTGDRALQMMSQLISALLFRQDPATSHSTQNLARIGSDEFAFLLAPIASYPHGGAVRICELLAKRLNDPIQLGDYQLQLRFSAGIISFPEAGSQVEELMQSASQARRYACRYAGNYWYLMDGACASKIREDKWLEGELTGAIPLQQFKVVFQPQYALSNGEITGAEVLLRWQHPEFGMVPPDRFIPIAEHSSQILDIDLWVLEQSCAFLGRLRQQGMEHFHLAVNASATELSNPSYPQHVERLLKEYAIPAAQLGIEITETALVELDEVARSMVQRLKALGVEIALDDFGTGYTSFKHLAELPVDSLKIDRSFTSHLEDDPKLVDSILQLATAFNLKVVAEGVETVQQLEILTAKGCDLAQGYLLSRPIDEASLLILLHSDGHPLAKQICSAQRAAKPETISSSST